MYLQLKDVHGNPLNLGDWVATRDESHGKWRKLSFICQLQIIDGLLFPVQGFSYSTLEKIETPGFDPAADPKQFVEATMENGLRYYRKVFAWEDDPGKAEDVRDLESHLSRYRFGLLSLTHNLGKTIIVSAAKP